MAETAASDSILSSVKKVLGIAEDYTVYDLDITLYINSVFSKLYQIADIGPEGGFSIQDKTAKWSDVLGENHNHLNMVYSYMCNSVRLLFDPPETSFAIDSRQKMIDEEGWRLSLFAPKPNSEVTS